MFIKLKELLYTYLYHLFKKSCGRGKDYLKSLNELLSVLVCGIFLPTDEL